MVHAEEVGFESSLKGLPDVVGRITEKVSINFQRPGILFCEENSLCIATFSWAMIEAAKSFFEHDFCHMDWIESVGAEMRVPDKVSLLTRRNSNL